MGKKRYIDTDFWTDTWVVDTLNPLDCHLFMYLLSNPQTTLCGVYKLSLRLMSFQTGIEREELARMLKRLEPKVYYVDDWVVLVNAIKHQNYRSPKARAALVRELKDVPDDVIKLVNYPIDLLEMFKVDYPTDTVLIPYLYRMHTSLHLTKTLPNLDLDLTKTLPRAAADDAAGSEKDGKLAKIPTQDITDMLEFWESTVGMKLGNEAGQRKAIAALLRQHGKDPLKKLVGGVVLALDDQYAPRISDFVSLKRKQNDLLVWGRKRQKQGNNVEVIS